MWRGAGQRVPREGMCRAFTRGGCAWGSLVHSWRVSSATSRAGLVLGSLQEGGGLPVSVLSCFLVSPRQKTGRPHRDTH